MSNHFVSCWDPSWDGKERAKKSSNFYKEFVLFHQRDYWFFFSFLAATQHMEFLGQGSDPSHSCSNPGSLTHSARSGESNLHPRGSETVPILLPTMRTPRDHWFLKIFFIMVDLQYFVNFCCTAEWPSHTSIYILFFTLSSIMSITSDCT